MINGVWMWDPGAIKKEIVDFYSELYWENVRIRPFLDDMEFDGISLQDREWLERPFLEEEVWAVVKRG